MNWKRGFRRIAFVLTIIGGALGGLVGWCTIDSCVFCANWDYWKLQPQWKLLSMSLSAGIGGVLIGCCLVWLVYKLLEWLVLGFRDNNR